MSVFAAFRTAVTAMSEAALCLLIKPIGLQKVLSLAGMTLNLLDAAASATG